MTTRSPGSVKDAMAASSPARPVPETGNVQGFCVWNTTRESAMTSCMIAVKSGSNWPSSGVDIARSTRGSAMLGPGPRRIRGVRSSSGTSASMTPPSDEMRECGSYHPAAASPRVDKVGSMS